MSDKPRRDTCLFGSPHKDTLSQEDFILCHFRVFRGDPNDPLYHPGFWCEHWSPRKRSTCGECHWWDDGLDSCGWDVNYSFRLAAAPSCSRFWPREEGE